MNQLERLQEFLTTQNADISLSGFLINLSLCAMLAFALSRIYVHYGKALSNRKLFARNFMLLAMTTMLVITVVKSSLALSLGLVGALSIVRFRAAIKEPEELAYLFLTIAIGLGLGADQRAITLVAFVVIAGLIWLANLRQRMEENQNLYLTISSHNPKKLELGKIVQILKAHCSYVNLKRFDETKELLEAAFFVEFGNLADVEGAKRDLQAVSDCVRINLLDNKGIV